MTVTKRPLLLGICCCFLLVTIFTSSGNQQISHAAVSSLVDEVLVEASHRYGGVRAVANTEKHLIAGIGRSVVLFSKASENRLSIVGQTPPLAGNVQDIVIGKGVAYVSADQGGLYAIDITRPYAPKVLWHRQVCLCQGLSLQNGLLAVAANRGGLVLIDVSNPSSPIERGQVHFPNAYRYVNKVSLLGSYAYVLVADVAFVVVDVASPVEPTIIWDLPLDNYPASLLVHHKRAYIVTRDGLLIYSLDNPASPVEIGSYEELGNSEGALYPLDDRYILASGSDLSLGSRVYVFDVQDPTDVKRVGFASVWAQDVTRFNEDFAISNYEGVHLLSIGNLSRPTTVNTYTTYPISHSTHLLLVNAETLIRSSPSYGGSSSSNNLYAFKLTDPYHPEPGNSLTLPAAVDALASSGSLLFAAADDGLHVIRVDESAELHRIGFASLDHNYSPSGIHLYDNYAYLSLSVEGLAVVDISDASKPRLITKLAGVEPDLMAGSSDTLYLIEDNWGDGRSFTVMSLSSATNPTVSGRTPIAYVVHDLVAVGSTVYGVDGQNLFIVDASNPSAPRIVRTLNVVPTPYELHEHDGTLYVSGADGQTVALDIEQSPTSPVERSRFKIRDSVSSLAASENVLYAIERNGGLTTLSWTRRDKTEIDKQGGELVANDGQVVYRFDSSSFPNLASHQPVEFEHMTLPEQSLLRLPPGIPSGVAFSNQALLYGDIVDESSVGLYELIVNYDSDLGPVDEESLGLWFYEGGQWVREPTSEVDIPSNQVTARPQRFGVWALAGTAKEASFMPSVSSAYGSVPPRILGMEITQGIQSLSNDVPLVAGRKTLVRVHAKVDSILPTDGVTLALEGSRDGQPLPGSPIRVNDWAVFPKHDRGELRKSFNLDLPASWLNGEIQLTARLESWWGSSNSNSTAARVRFGDVPPLEVVLVPIQTHDKTNGVTCPSPLLAPLLNSQEYWSQLMSLFPVSEVNITARAPVTLEAEDLREILEKVTSLKSADGIPSNVIYYGVVGRHTVDYTAYCLDNDPGGLGWIGNRVSVGNQAPITLAHEVGHNLDLGHAPCGDAPGPDPEYPYAGASIGEYGYDIVGGRIQSPGVPDFAKDFMGYCSPEWVSDYHFRKLYDDQRANGRSIGQVETEKTLLIRITRDAETGIYHIHPVYQLEATPSIMPESGEVELELLDKNDRLVGSYPVQFSRAAEGDILAEAATLNVPLIEQSNIATIRIVQAGNVLAERNLTIASTPVNDVALDFDVRQRNLTLSWSKDDHEVLIRFKEEGRDGWTTYALDSIDESLVLSGAMIPTEAGHFEIIAADVVGSGSSAYVNAPGY